MNRQERTYCQAERDVVIIRITFLAALLYLATCTNTLSEDKTELEPLHCNVSGHAQCSKDGWCIGAGTATPTITMTIAADGRSLSLNGINGLINGDGSFLDKKEHQILWDFSVIRYYRIYVRDINGIVASLLNDNDNELEFKCSTHTVP